MSNNRRQGLDTIGDPDGDFDGTFPGSKPYIDISSRRQKDDLESPESKPRGVHTNSQWRNYFNPLVISGEPSTGSAVSAGVDSLSPQQARDLAMGYGGLALQKTLEVADKRPVLRDANGRAVIGSAAMDEGEIQNYLASHPGASFE